MDKQLKQWLECIDIIDCICIEKSFLSNLFTRSEEHSEIIKNIAPDLEDVLLLMKTTFDKQKYLNSRILACDILQQNKRVTLDSVFDQWYRLALKRFQRNPS